MENSMAPNLNDTQMILNAISDMKLELKKDIDEKHHELKKTLFGEDGTEGLCGTVKEHTILLCGMPGVVPGVVADVLEIKKSKENQSYWNKGLSVSQVVTWVGLGLKAVFGGG